MGRVRVKSPAQRLIAAIKRGNIPSAKSAIADGPDYTELVDQVTALHWAVHCHQIEIARLMLEAGADPDMRNGMDETPLIFCATTNSCSDDEAVSFAALLLSHGAAVTPRTESGHIHLPLTMARIRRKTKLAALLEEHGAATFDALISMQDMQGQPIRARFFYGPTWATSFDAAESDAQGRLRLEAVIEGPFVVGFLEVRDRRAEIVVQGDGTVSPSMLTWTTH